MHIDRLDHRVPTHPGTEPSMPFLSVGSHLPALVSCMADGWRYGIPKFSVTSMFL